MVALHGTVDFWLEILGASLPSGVAAFTAAGSFVSSNNLHFQSGTGAGVKRAWSEGAASPWIFLMTEGKGNFVFSLPTHRVRCESIFDYKNKKEEKGLDN